MTVTYEWDVEQVASVEHSTKHQDFGVGDVIEHFHQGSYRECVAFMAANPPPENSRYEVCIVRDSFSERTGESTRAWAYIEDGVLAEAFHDAIPSKVCDTPKRFFAEIERVKG